MDYGKLKIISNECDDSFSAFRHDPVEMGCSKIGGYTQTPYFPLYWKSIYNLPIENNEIFIASPPKSGTTWTQQMTYLIETGDFEKASNVIMDDRYLFLDLATIFGLPDDLLERHRAFARPKMYKTHLPAKFLPRNVHKAKLIFVYRNVKDVAVSYYHHYTSVKVGLFRHFKGNFLDFAKYFMNGDVLTMPYGKMVTEYFELKKSGKIPNMLILRYEDMSTDPKGAIRQIAAFLEKNIDEETVERIYQATTFESMKDNNASNYSWLENGGIWQGSKFMRKGMVGEWKEYFTDPDFVKEFDDKIKATIPEGLYHVLE